MELREKIARAVSKWPCHIDGFHVVGYSTAACERWRATAYAQADEILALIGHDSDCAQHNMPEKPNGPCDCSLSR